MRDFNTYKEASTTTSCIKPSTGTYLTLNLVLQNRIMEENNSYQTARHAENTLILLLLQYTEWYSLKAKNKIEIL